MVDDSFAAFPVLGDAAVFIAFRDASVWAMKRP